MVCTSTFDIQTVGDFLVWPTGCSYFFYLIIFVGILIVLTYSLFKAEEERVNKSNLVPALAITCLALTFIALIGTFIQNRAGIPMIQPDIFLYIIAICIPVVLIWIFKGKA